MIHLQGHCEHADDASRVYHITEYLKQTIVEQHQVFSVTMARGLALSCSHIHTV